jgi:hypothetical protein
VFLESTEDQLEFGELIWARQLNGGFEMEPAVGWLRSPGMYSTEI